MHFLQAVLLALVAVSSATCKTECPSWTTFNSTTRECECGSDLQGVVTCNRNTLEIFLLRCFCMTYDEHTDTTEVGPCYFTCKRKYLHVYYREWKVQSNNSQEFEPGCLWRFSQNRTTLCQMRRELPASQFIRIPSSVQNA